MQHDDPEHSDDDDIDFDAARAQVYADSEPKIAREPVFAALLRASVERIHGDDPVLLDLVNMVVPQLSALLGHKTAKGGDFVVKQRLEGMDEEKLKRYAHDQSMRAHLLNGLLPALHIARLLKAWDVPRFRREFTEETQRLFCAGYILHDWVKLPGTEEELDRLGLNHATVNAAHDLKLVEKLFNGWCKQLGLHDFLAPLGEHEDYLHDLIRIASNTQIQWGTMQNLAALPDLNPRFQHQTALATDLSTLADYLTYLGRTPVEAVLSPAISRQLADLSNRQARLVYQHVAEVRGMLSNMINHTAQELYERKGAREAILFAPTGTIYLERTGTDAPTPTLDEIAEQTVERIQAACRDLLGSELQGFKRDGKGLKYAPFYDNFFTPQQLAPVIVKAATARIKGKSAKAPMRYAKMVETGMLQPEQLAQLPQNPDSTLDILAEGLALLAKELRDHAPSINPQQWILEQLQLAELDAELTAIPQRASTGGVPYEWYFAAGSAWQRHSHRSPEEWINTLTQITEAAQAHLDPILSVAKFDTLKEYVRANLRIGLPQSSNQGLRQQLLKEQAAYSGASRSQRSTNVCALCSSAYPVEEQREAAILFAPMVYSNKQPLHSSKATRHICTICELEMMLRVLLMSRSAATGKNFEARRMRYLFFYPTYYWTPETLQVFEILQANLKSISITALRKLLIDLQGDSPTFDTQPATFQQLRDVFMEARELGPDTKPDSWLRYSSKYGGAFGFVGIPSGRDVKEAEAWVQPALLALLLPLIIDVKVVASESMIPVLNEATELHETVLFDGPHQFVSRLVQPPQVKIDPDQRISVAEHNRINLDNVQPALTRLLSAYFMHIDANSAMPDYRWNALPALARNLSESSLQVFAALQRWHRRRNKGDTIPVAMAQLYLQFELLFRSATQGGLTMTHAEELVTRYRQFYRARGWKTNAILRPIAIAAEVVLDAHQGLFDPQAEQGAALIQAVRGRLQTFVRNVIRKTADGRLPTGSNRELREHAIDEFSTYFVRDIFLESLNGDPAMLRGKQLNLLKNACEVLYLDAEKRERTDQGDELPDDDAEIDAAD